MVSQCDNRNTNSYCTVRSNQLILKMTITEKHTSSDSDRNSCMMSLSPITRTEQTRNTVTQKRRKREESSDQINRKTFARIHAANIQQPTTLKIFLQASPASIQLLLRQGEGPFPRKLWEIKVGKLPLKVLVEDGKLPIALWAQLPAWHVHVIYLWPLKNNSRRSDKLDRIHLIQLCWKAEERWRVESALTTNLSECCSTCLYVGMEMGTACLSL